MPELLDLANAHPCVMRDKPFLLVEVLGFSCEKKADTRIQGQLWGMVLIILSTCSGHLSWEEVGDVPPPQQVFPVLPTQGLALPLQPPGWYLQVGMSWNLTKV